MYHDLSLHHLLETGVLHITLIQNTHILIYKILPSFNTYLEHVLNSAAKFLKMDNEKKFYANKDLHQVFYKCKEGNPQVSSSNSNKF